MNLLKWTVFGFVFLSKMSFAGGSSCDAEYPRACVLEKRLNLLRKACPPEVSAVVVQGDSSVRLNCGMEFKDVRREIARLKELSSCGTGDCAGTGSVAAQAENLQDQLQAIAQYQGQEPGVCNVLTGKPAKKVCSYIQNLQERLFPPANTEPGEKEKKKIVQHVKVDPVARKEALQAYLKDMAKWTGKIASAHCELPAQACPAPPPIARESSSDKPTVPPRDYELRRGDALLLPGGKRGFLLGIVGKRASVLLDERSGQDFCSYDLRDVRPGSAIRNLPATLNELRTSEEEFNQSMKAFTRGVLNDPSSPCNGKTLFGCLNAFAESCSNLGMSASRKQGVPSRKACNLLRKSSESRKSLEQSIDLILVESYRLLERLPATSKEGQTKSRGQLEKDTSTAANTLWNFGNQKSAAEAYKNYTSKQKEWNDMFSGLEEDPVLGGVFRKYAEGPMKAKVGSPLGARDYIAKPFQRFLKYALFARELSKHSDEMMLTSSPDTVKAEEALAQLGNKVNSSLSTGTNTKR